MGGLLDFPELIFFIWPFTAAALLTGAWIVVGSVSKSLLALGRE